MPLNYKMSIAMSAICGFILGGSFIPFVPWGVFFSYALLWRLWLQLKTPKKIFISAWVFQFAMSFVIFNWVIFTLHEFGNFPWFVCFLLFLVFCSLAQIFIPLYALLFSYLYKKFQPTPFLSLLLLSLLASLSEIVFPTIFKGHFGYVWLYKEFPMYQWAEYIGFYGLSFINFLFNILFYYIIDEIIKYKKSVFLQKRFYQLLSLSLMSFITLNITGMIIKNQIPTPDKTVSVQMIQGNLGRIHSNQQQEQIFQRYKKLTKKNKTDQFHITLWPEVAYPYKVSLLKKNTNRRLKKFIKEKNIYLITGASSYYKYKPTNSLMSFNPDGVLESFYHKTKLLVFGEYLPLREHLPRWTRKYTWMVSEFYKGEEIKTMSVNTLTLGPQICYESLYTSHSAQLSRQKAHLFINVTNDSWFGSWMEPYQHLFISLGRAIEFRKPLIRTTNTGISAAIRSDGHILAQSQSDTIWEKTIKVPYHFQPIHTFYEKYFNYLFSLLFLSLLFLIGFIIKKRKR